MTIHMQDAATGIARRRAWLRRIGTYGFAFFFIKGMAWLALPLALWLFD